MRWIITLFFMIQTQVIMGNHGMKHEVCKPYKAVIIWDIVTEEDSIFYPQRGFISQLIKEMPDGSIIRLKIVGTNKVTSVNFETLHLDESWKEKIAAIERAKYRNISISYEHIKIELFDVLNSNMSEEYFFIVNECSEITEDIIKTLQRKKTFVAYFGNEGPLDIWIKLSTRNDHLLHLLSYNVDSTINPFSEMACEDSLLVCDTDLYWNGRVCYRCSYICTDIPSEFCMKECPYYKTFETRISSNGIGIDTHNNRKITIETECSDNSYFDYMSMTFAIIFLVLLILSVSVLTLLVIRKMFKDVEKKINALINEN